MDIRRYKDRCNLSSHVLDNNSIVNNDNSQHTDFINVKILDSEGNVQKEAFSKWYILLNKKII